MTPEARIDILDWRDPKVYYNSGMTFQQRASWDCRDFATNTLGSSIDQVVISRSQDGEDYGVYYRPRAQNSEQLAAELTTLSAHFQELNDLGWEGSVRLGCIMDFTELETALVNNGDTVHAFRTY